MIEYQPAIAVLPPFECIGSSTVSFICCAQFWGAKNLLRIFLLLIGAYARGLPLWAKPPIWGAIEFQCGAKEARGELQRLVEAEAFFQTAFQQPLG